MCVCVSVCVRARPESEHRLDLSSLQAPHGGVVATVVQDLGHLQGQETTDRTDRHVRGHA
ncbi:MAG TPA: hypothetical protein V6C97_34110 [Oculatellaceae cyanobacterium]